MKPVKGAKACPFCGQVPTQVDVIFDSLFNKRIAILHSDARMGDYVCPLNASKIPMTAWNKRIVVRRKYNG